MSALEGRAAHAGAPERPDVRGDAVSGQEIFEASLAEKHDPGLGIFEPQVFGERGGKDDIADELRLDDQDRAENLGHLFLTPAVGRPANWAETLSGLGAVTRKFA
ncbi:hypothetical protein [Mesorhizobium sp. STM 4661]|uniref:hypothetical protein n=1 Tax=Mesorhizobium sp. STM 4661 TaxID=1297570 RepID=UPI001FCAEF9E|nr:hypothetical protein [Mesorhizobium sp. STM 4661]